MILLLLVLGAYLALMLEIPSTPAISQLASSGNDNTTMTYPPLTNDTMEIFPVDFLTDEEVREFFNEMNYTITPISNSTLGDANNVKTATVENTTYIAWQGNINNTNDVFLTITYDGGANYTNLRQLTPQNASASELQIFASDNIVSLIWFDYNQTTGKSSIFGSRSIDSGQHFNTFRITFLDTNATNLALANHNVVLWIQEDECGGDGNGNGPPPDNNLPTSIVEGQEGFIEVGVISPGMPPGGVLCAHKW
jgi:hypothetical protein